MLSYLMAKKCSLSLEPADNSLPTKRQWSTRKKTIVGAIVLSAILVSLGYVFSNAEANCPLITVVPTGTILSIQPAGHIGYNFTVPKVVTSRIVYMSISADNGVVLYLMTPSQYSGFNSTGAAGSYVWKTGQVTSFYCGSTGSADCAQSLPQRAPYVPSVGVYYFVVSDPSSSVVAKVTVSSQVQVGPC